MADLAWESFDWTSIPGVSAIPLRDAGRHPAFKQVYIDLSWGPIVAPCVIDTPEHLKMSLDLFRKYPDRFLYGSDQGATADWNVVRKSYNVWEPPWKELGPELTQQVAKDNYARLFDQSRKNIRAWESTHPEPGL